MPFGYITNNNERDFICGICRHLDVESNLYEIHENQSHFAHISCLQNIYNQAFTQRRYYLPCPHDHCPFRLSQRELERMRPPELVEEEEPFDIEQAASPNPIQIRRILESLAGEEGFQESEPMEQGLQEEEKIENTPALILTPPDQEIPSFGGEQSASNMPNSNLRFEDVIRSGNIENIRRILHAGNYSYLDYANALASYSEILEPEIGELLRNNPHFSANDHAGLNLILATLNQNNMDALSILEEEEQINPIARARAAFYALRGDNFQLFQAIINHGPISPIHREDCDILIGVLDEETQRRFRQVFANAQYADDDVSDLSFFVQNPNPGFDAPPPPSGAPSESEEDDFEIEDVGY